MISTRQGGWCGWIAPAILGLYAENERLVRAPTCRRDGSPGDSRTGQHRNGQLKVGKGIEIAGCLNVRHHPEIAACFGKCLGQQPGASLPPVAKANRDFLARAKISAMLPDGQNLALWSLAAHAAVFKR